MQESVENETYPYRLPVFRIKNTSATSVKLNDIEIDNQRNNVTYNENALRFLRHKQNLNNIDTSSKLITDGNEIAPSIVVDNSTTDSTSTSSTTLFSTGNIYSTEYLNTLFSNSESTKMNERLMGDTMVVNVYDGIVIPDYTKMDQPISSKKIMMTEKNLIGKYLNPDGLTTFDSTIRLRNTKDLSTIYYNQDDNDLGLIAKSVIDVPDVHETIDLSNLIINNGLIDFSEYIVSKSNKLYKQIDNSTVEKINNVDTENEVKSIEKMDVVDCTTKLSVISDYVRQDNKFENSKTQDYFSIPCDTCSTVSLVNGYRITWVANSQTHTYDFTYWSTSGSLNIKGNNINGDSSYDAFYSIYPSMALMYNSPITGYYKYDSNEVKTSMSMAGKCFGRGTRIILEENTKFSITDSQQKDYPQIFNFHLNEDSVICSSVNGKMIIVRYDSDKKYMYYTGYTLSEANNIIDETSFDGIYLRSSVTISDHDSSAYVKLFVGQVQFRDKGTDIVLNNRFRFLNSMDLRITSAKALYYINYIDLRVPSVINKGTILKKGTTIYNESNIDLVIDTINNGYINVPRYSTKILTQDAELTDQCIVIKGYIQAMPGSIFYGSIGYNGTCNGEGELKSYLFSDYMNESIGIYNSFSIPSTHGKCKISVSNRFYTTTIINYNKSTDETTTDSVISVIEENKTYLVTPNNQKSAALDNFMFNILFEGKHIQVSKTTSTKYIDFKHNNVVNEVETISYTVFNQTQNVNVNYKFVESTYKVNIPEFVYNITYPDAETKIINEFANNVKKISPSELGINYTNVEPISSETTDFHNYTTKLIDCKLNGNVLRNFENTENNNYYIEFIKHDLIKQGSVLLSGSILNNEQLDSNTTLLTDVEITDRTIIQPGSNIVSGSRINDKNIQKFTFKHDNTISSDITIQAGSFIKLGSEIYDSTYIKHIYDRDTILNTPITAMKGSNFKSGTILNLSDTIIYYPNDVIKINEFKPGSILLNGCVCSSETTSEDNIIDVITGFNTSVLAPGSIINEGSYTQVESLITNSSENELFENIYLKKCDLAYYGTPTNNMKLTNTLITNTTVINKGSYVDAYVNGTYSSYTTDSDSVFKNVCIHSIDSTKGIKIDCDMFKSDTVVENKNVRIFNANTKEFTTSSTSNGVVTLSENCVYSTIGDNLVPEQTDGTLKFDKIIFKQGSFLSKGSTFNNKTVDFEPGLNITQDTTYESIVLQPGSLIKSGSICITKHNTLVENDDYYISSVQLLSDSIIKHGSYQKVNVPIDETINAITEYSNTTLESGSLIKSGSKINDVVVNDDVLIKSKYSNITLQSGSLIKSGSILKGVFTQDTTITKTNDVIFTKLSLIDGSTVNGSVVKSNFENVVVESGSLIKSGSKINDVVVNDDTLVSTDTSVSTSVFASGSKLIIENVCHNILTDFENIIVEPGSLIKSGSTCYIEIMEDLIVDDLQNINFTSCSFIEGSKLITSESTIVVPTNKYSKIEFNTGSVLSSGSEYNRLLTNDDLNKPLTNVYFKRDSILVYETDELVNSDKQIVNTMKFTNVVLKSPITINEFNKIIYTSSTMNDYKLKNVVLNDGSILKKGSKYKLNELDEYTNVESDTTILHNSEHKYFEIVFSKSSVITFGSYQLIETKNYENNVIYPEIEYSLNQNIPELNEGILNGEIINENTILPTLLYTNNDLIPYCDENCKYYCSNQEIKSIEPGTSCKKIVLKPGVVHNGLVKYSNSTVLNNVVLTDFVGKLTQNDYKLTDSTTNYVLYNPGTIIKIGNINTLVTGNRFKNVSLINWDKTIIVKQSVNDEYTIMDPVTDSTIVHKFYEVIAENGTKLKLNDNFITVFDSNLNIQLTNNEFTVFIGFNPSGSVLLDNGCKYFEQIMDENTISLQHGTYFLNQTEIYLNCEFLNSTTDYTICESLLNNGTGDISVDEIAVYHYEIVENTNGYIFYDNIYIPEYNIIKQNSIYGGLEINSVKNRFTNVMFIPENTNCEITYDMQKVVYESTFLPEIYDLMYVNNCVLANNSLLDCKTCENDVLYTTPVFIPKNTDYNILIVNQPIDEQIVLSGYNKYSNGIVLSIGSVIKQGSLINGVEITADTVIYDDSFDNNYYYLVSGTQFENGTKTDKYTLGVVPKKINIVVGQNNVIKSGSKIISGSVILGNEVENGDEPIILSSDVILKEGDLILKGSTIYKNSVINSMYYEQDTVLLHNIIAISNTSIVCNMFDKIDNYACLDFTENVSYESDDYGIICIDNNVVNEPMRFNNSVAKMCIKTNVIKPNIDDVLPAGVYTFSDSTTLNVNTNFKFSECGTVIQPSVINNCYLEGYYFDNPDTKIQFTGGLINKMFYVTGSENSIFIPINDPDGVTFGAGTMINYTTYPNGVTFKAITGLLNDMIQNDNVITFVTTETTGNYTLKLINFKNDTDLVYSSVIGDLIVENHRDYETNRSMTEMIQNDTPPHYNIDLRFRLNLTSAQIKVLGKHISGNLYSLLVYPKYTSCLVGESLILNNDDFEHDDFEHHQSEAIYLYYYLKPVDKFMSLNDMDDTGKYCKLKDFITLDQLTKCLPIEYEINNNDIGHFDTNELVQTYETVSTMYKNNIEFSYSQNDTSKILNCVHRLNNSPIKLINNDKYTMIKFDQNKIVVLEFCSNPEHNDIDSITDKTTVGSSVMPVKKFLSYTQLGEAIIQNTPNNYRFYIKQEGKYILVSQQEFINNFDSLTGTFTISIAMNVYNKNTEKNYEFVRETPVYNYEFMNMNNTNVRQYVSYPNGLPYNYKRDFAGINEENYTNTLNKVLEYKDCECECCNINGILSHDPSKSGSYYTILSNLEPGYMSIKNENLDSTPIYITTMLPNINSVNFVRGEIDFVDQNDEIIQSNEYLISYENDIIKVTIYSKCDEISVETVENMQIITVDDIINDVPHIGANSILKNASKINGSEPFTDPETLITSVVYLTSGETYISKGSVLKNSYINGRYYSSDNTEELQEGITVKLGLAYGNIIEFSNPEVNYGSILYPGVPYRRYYTFYIPIINNTGKYNIIPKFDVKINSFVATSDKQTFTENDLINNIKTPVYIQQEIITEGSTQSILIGDYIKKNSIINSYVYTNDTIINNFITLGSKIITDENVVEFNNVLKPGTTFIGDTKLVIVEDGETIERIYHAQDVIRTSINVLSGTIMKGTIVSKDSVLNTIVYTNDTTLEDNVSLIEKIVFGQEYQYSEMNKISELKKLNKGSIISHNSFINLNYYNNDEVIDELIINDSNLVSNGSVIKRGSVINGVELGEDLNIEFIKTNDELYYLDTIYVPADNYASVYDLIRVINEKLKESINKNLISDENISVIFKDNIKFNFQNPNKIILTTVNEETWNLTFDYSCFDYKLDVLTLKQGDKLKIVQETKNNGTSDVYHGIAVFNNQEPIKLKFIHNEEELTTFINSEFNKTDVFKGPETMKFENFATDEAVNDNMFNNLINENDDFITVDEEKQGRRQIYKFTVPIIPVEFTEIDKPDITDFNSLVRQYQNYQIAIDPNANTLIQNEVISNTTEINLNNDPDDETLQFATKYLTKYFAAEKFYSNFKQNTRSLWHKLGVEPVLINKDLRPKILGSEDVDFAIKSGIYNTFNTIVWYNYISSYFNETVYVDLPNVSPATIQFNHDLYYNQERYKSGILYNLNDFNLFNTTWEAERLVNLKVPNKFSIKTSIDSGIEYIMNTGDNATTVSDVDKLEFDDTNNTIKLNIYKTIDVSKVDELFVYIDADEHYPFVTGVNAKLNIEWIFENNKN